MSAGLAEEILAQREDQDQNHEIDYTPASTRFTPSPDAVRTVARALVDKTRAKQRGLGFDGEVLKETLIRNLHACGLPEQARTLENCHTRQTVARCHACYKVQVFYNRCENFFCPVCARRLASDRRKSVEWWCDQVRQPKHVVVTTRNTETLTPQTVRGIKDAWAKLRRRKFARGWKGGFYSLEITNEGRGWHLHIHALIDAYYIDAGKLAREWADCVGQDYAIVKVKDARGKDYIRELCKYIVEGNQLVKWSPEKLREYILAFTGQRTFGVFGEFYQLRKEHRKFVDELQSQKLQCECGCTIFKFYNENEWEWHECVNGRPDRPLIVQTRGTTSQNSLISTQPAWGF